jgi:bifunctional oligoribonuclease and PAP phosphatase NrnA
MIRKILSKINAGKTFLITTHENPDGDAAGSTMALGCFLASLGKEVTIYYSDALPENYAFLPLASSAVYTIPDKDFDVSFILDAGDIKRAGADFCAFRRHGAIINIDHHPYGEQFGDLNYVDCKASATGALIYRIIKESGHEINYQTALCIYTAIVTDTGSFRYSNADSEAFRISSELVELGINPWFIAEKLYESQPRKRLELLALALGTLHVSEQGDFASITIRLDMYEKTGANSDVTDGFVNYPRSIHGVEVAILFREVNHEVYKIAFRSKGKVNVSELAIALGGGGHHNAAGCLLHGPIEEVKKTVYSLLERAL